jgi:hypothetical protein
MVNYPEPILLSFLVFHIMIESGVFRYPERLAKAFKITARFFAWTGWEEATVSFKQQYEAL